MDIVVGKNPYSLLTLWFVTAAEPRTVINSELQADRGFARKYLNQLNNRWPLTHIGDFDMTRSASPGLHEFYIGAYPGLTVIQTVVPGLVKPSEIPQQMREYIPAADVYATVIVPEGSSAVSTGDSEGDLWDEDYTGLAGFAHWRGDKLVRSFCATREKIFEDTGLPSPGELPFWEGNTESSGIQLPFIPAELAVAATESLLGFNFSAGGPEIPVTAFAIDGRPEAKNKPIPGVIENRKINRSWKTDDDDPDQRAYDDYARPNTHEGAASTSELARDMAVSITHDAKRGLRSLRGLAGRIGDEVRRRARHTDRG